MDRRRLLLLAGGGLAMPAAQDRGASAAEPSGTPSYRRSRPGDVDWPAEADWAALNQRLGGRLMRPRSPFAACGNAVEDAACQEARRHLRNPYYLGDEPALTQTSGWADAWVSAPSAYAVAARDAADVAAAVGFARDHRLRLVVKGGGHSYQGTSNAPDSLLVWTRPMQEVTLHEAFTGQGCEGREPVRPAVSLGAGVRWLQAYEAVTTGAGRYVQGGGCTTVGVAGLVQSGGFGSFSKRYGLAAASLLEAEVVTADGVVRIANACTEPELFWGLKGGGGGSLGVVTRLTLATHPLPETFGAVFGAIQARSDEAFQRLIARFIGFYAAGLFNPHWGETVRLRPDNALQIGMLFQDLDQATAERQWRPLLDWVAQAPQDYVLAAFQVLALPARRMWDAAWLRQNAPGLVAADDRPGAPAGNFFWTGDGGQVGQFLHSYESAWLPASLLAPEAQARLADGLFAATRHWRVTLHFNKGLAGAPAEAIAAARDTAVHPSMLDAFALAISAAEGPPGFPGLPGPPPDLALARQHRTAIAAAMAELRKLAPGTGAYVSEANYFEPDWQGAYWGANYPRLLAVKQRYDPEGLFFVHHGVGAERWSADGFTRLD
jgi:FAD/FMN-containing dehydrogenase